MDPVTKVCCLLSLALGGASAGGAAAGVSADARQAIVDATRWLVEHQAEDGSWGSHHSPRPIEVLADVPGSHEAFRYATTALCTLALAEDPAGSEAGRAAAERGIDYLLASWNVKRVSGMEHYNVWSFGYGLECLGAWLEQQPGDPRADELRGVCAALVQKLRRYQVLDGGWGYLSLFGARTYQPSDTSMSFTTATVLIGLERAKRVGVEVPEELERRALDSLERCRTPRGAFTYGQLWNRSPLAEINRLQGAACRTPVCQLALQRLGRAVPLGDHRRALQDLLVRHARFQVAALRRPIPHESWYAVSGYFYLYGHYYAAQVLAQLLPADERPALAEALARAVLRCRQPDGSFWDYPLYSYHKPYGTAFALMALARVTTPEGEAQRRAE